MNTNNLPNLPELGQMAKKLFGELKKSVGEIFQDYKCKHSCEEKKEVKKTASSIKTSTVKPAVKKKTTVKKVAAKVK
jgi:hypothetical protein